MKKCPQCGTLNQSTAKFCSSCGQSLMAVSVQSNSAKQKRLAAVLLICVLVAVGGYFAYTKLDTKATSIAMLKAKTARFDPREKQRNASSKQATLTSLKKENKALKQHKASRQAVASETTASNDPEIKPDGALSFSDLQGDWILVKRANDPEATLPVGLSFRPHAIEESFKSGPDNTLNIDTIRWSSTDRLYYLSGSADQFAVNLEQKYLSGQKRVLLKHIDQGRTAWYQRH